MATTAPGLTPTGTLFVVTITLLSLSHHVDHLLRDVTGWPFEGGFNPFSASLLVYPVIVVGLVLSRRGRVGPRFWAALAGGGALFVLGVHVGPTAGDSISDIPRQYASRAAEVASIAVLVAFVAALVGHFIYEWRRARATPRQEGVGERATR